MVIFTAQQQSNTSPNYGCGIQDARPAIPCIESLALASPWPGCAAPCMYQGPSANEGGTGWNRSKLSAAELKGGIQGLTWVQIFPLVFVSSTSVSSEDRDHSGSYYYRGGTERITGWETSDSRALLPWTGSVISDACLCVRRPVWPVPSTVVRIKGRTIGIRLANCKVFHKLKVFVLWFIGWLSVPMHLYCRVRLNVPLCNPVGVGGDGFQAT